MEIGITKEIPTYSGGLGVLAGDIALIGTDRQPTNWETELAKWGIHGIGFLATVGITFYLTKVAKRILDGKVS